MLQFTDTIVQTSYKILTFIAETLYLSELLRMYKKDVYYLLEFSLIDYKCLLILKLTI